MQKHSISARPGLRLVCCRYFRHHITGQIVYPKRASCFRFWVRAR
jgi:hypothetical protein